MACMKIMQVICEYKHGANRSYGHNNGFNNQPLNMPLPSSGIRPSQQSGGFSNQTHTPLPSPAFKPGGESMRSFGGDQQQSFENQYDSSNPSYYSAYNN